MTPIVLLSILLISFIVFVLLGSPIAVSLLASSVITILVDPNLELVIVPLRMYSGINNFVLIAIPGFMFAAFLMNSLRITDDIVSVADVMVGYIRGGLAHVNIVASMLFAGVSGSSSADTAGIGSILIPAMNKQGYGRGFSAAITAASSTIGNIIPPSIFMVVYGATAGISIGGLFLAGIIPGVIIGLSQIGIAYGYAVKYNYGTRRSFPSVGEILGALRKGIWPLLLVVIIIGGIIGGIYTASEAAGMSVLYVLIIGAFVYRSLDIKKIRKALTDTAVMTAAVLFAVASATLFAYLMSYYNALDPVSDFFVKNSSSPILFMVYVLVIFVLLGTFMDPVPAMIIMVPILVPIAANLGVHPLMLGILTVMALCVGKITPPYGISLLLACAIAEVPITKAMKPTILLFLGFLLVMTVIIFVPQLALAIPEAIMPDLFG